MCWFVTIRFGEEFKTSVSLDKICQNTGFIWPVYSRIRTKSTILTLKESMRVRENPYSDIFYVVFNNEILQKKIM